MEVGTFVAHPIFGIGLITETREWSLMIQFEDKPRLISTAYLSDLMPVRVARSYERKFTQREPTRKATVTAADCVLLWSMGIRVDDDMVKPK